MLANCLAILERNVRLPPGCVRDCRIVADRVVKAVTLVVCLMKAPRSLVSLLTQSFPVGLQTVAQVSTLPRAVESMLHTKSV